MTIKEQNHLRIVLYEGTGSRPLEANDRFVFNPEDSTLYVVHTQWSDEHQGYYVDFARAITTLEGVTDLSASDLVLNSYFPDLSSSVFAVEALA